MSLADIDLSQGTLLLIGAGAAPGLEARLTGSGAPARVILVEPHALTAKALTARFASWPQVTVMALAIGQPDGSAEPLFQVANNLAHSSLRAPLPALLDLLPGLRMLKPQPVEIWSASQLMEYLGDLPRPVHLSIDAPGAEQDIVMSLEASGHLEQIDSIDLRAGREPLYEGTLGSDDLKDMLCRAGFSLQSIGLDDPDWPEVRLVVDRSRREMQQELARARVENAALGQKFAGLAAAMKEYEALLARRDAELDEARNSGESIARLNADRERAMTSTVQALETKSKALAATEAALHVAETALEETQARLRRVEEQSLAASQDHAHQIAAAEAEAARVQQELVSQLRKAEGQLLETVPKQSKLIETAETEVARARQDLLIALRLQAIATDDLRALQIKFAETLEIKAQQEALLRQLTPRLQEASAQLRELMQLPPQAAPSALMVTKSAKAGKKAKLTVNAGKPK